MPMFPTLPPEGCRHDRQRHHLSKITVSMDLPYGASIKIAWVVITCQRPGTVKGVCFITPSPTPLSLPIRNTELPIPK
jgi:hypothetical protein